MIRILRNFALKRKSKIKGGTVLTLAPFGATFFMFEGGNYERF